MPRIGLLSAHRDDDKKIIYRQLNQFNLILARIDNAINYGNWNWVDQQDSTSRLIGPHPDAIDGYRDAADIKNYCDQLNKGKNDGKQPDNDIASQVNAFINNLFDLEGAIDGNYCLLLSSSGVLLSKNKEIILVDYGWTCDKPDLKDNFPLNWIHDGKQNEIAINGCVQDYSNQKTIARFVAYILTGDEKAARDKDFFKSAAPESQAGWKKIVEAQTTTAVDLFNIKLNVNDLFAPLPSQKIKRAISKTSQVIMIFCLLTFFASFAGLFLKNYPQVFEKVIKFVENLKNIVNTSPVSGSEEVELKHLKEVYLDNEKMLDGNVFERTNAVKKIKEALKNNPKAKDALDGLQFVNWVNTKISQ